jgi:hypothetical protein
LMIAVRKMRPSKKKEPLTSKCLKTRKKARSQRICFKLTTKLEDLIFATIAVKNLMLERRFLGFSFTVDTHFALSAYLCCTITSECAAQFAGSLLSK